MTDRRRVDNKPNFTASRRLALLVGLIMALVALSGCGGDSDGATRETLPAVGVDSHLDDLPLGERRAELARLAGMGASWVRAGAPWYALQPEPGAFNPAASGELSQLVQDAASLGLNVLIIGDQAPDWAGGGDHTASNPQAYGAFMGQLAQELRGLGPGGISPAYELMNEPNGLIREATWAEPVEYAQSSCAAYQAIKDADPAATVLAGSLDVSDWQAWLRTALQAGLADCFDALSAHPYAGMAVLDEVRAVAAWAGRPNLEIWVTEFGESTCGDPELFCVSEPEQAAKLVASLRELGNAYPYVPVAIIYEARDEPEAAGPGEEPTPKPAVAAIRKLYLGN